MEVSNYELANLKKNLENKAVYFENKNKVKEETSKQTIKVSLLNVDSLYREQSPKNICENTKTYLPNDPITTKKGDSLLKINYPDHSLSEGDLITINNVESFDLTLSSSLFLINNINYLIIKIDDHGIPDDYKDYIDEIFIDISLKSTLTETFYGTVPINMLLGKKKVRTFQELSLDYVSLQSIYFVNMIEKIKEEFGFDNSLIPKNFIFVQLDFTFQTTDLKLFKITDVFNIKFNSLNGISLQEINADYPINYYRNQGFNEIKSTEIDYIYVNCDSKAYSNSIGGGNEIIINKILKTTPGYPNAGEFSIQLRKDFTDVVRMELVSSEFSFSEFIVQKNVNNKLYWQHLDDGDKIYSLSIPSGNYNSNNLIETILDKINNIERVKSTPENKIYNKFEIILNSFTNEIKFFAFSDNLLPNSISESIIVLQNKEYYKLDIKHNNNFVSVGDEITISNSESIGVIPKSSINKTHIVYSVNNEDSTYSVILSAFNPISSTLNSSGGASVQVKTVAKVRFLFNYSDTLGTILNFKNPGDDLSITPFNSVISNFDDYIFSSNLNSVGNVTSDNSFLRLKGNINYWLLYINNFESVILNNGIENCFAKILLPGSQGDTIFNSFVNSPVEFDIPIPTVSELNVRVTDLYGNVVNFENTNYSFTLRVYQKISIPIDTGKFSQDTSYDKELIEQIDKSNLKH